jgi:hypothetical protein
MSMREAALGAYWESASHGVVLEGAFLRGTKTKEKANERVQILHTHAANR